AAAPVRRSPGAVSAGLSICACGQARSRTKWLIIARRVTTTERAQGFADAPTIPVSRTAVEAAANSGPLASEGPLNAPPQPRSGRRPGDGSAPDRFRVGAAEPHRAHERRCRDPAVDPDGNDGQEFRGAI